MSWSASGMMTDTLADALNNGIALDLSSDTLKIALFDNSVSVAFDTASAAYGSSPWNTGEVDMGTSPWNSGGVALTSNALTGGSGNLKLDADDVSVDSTTLSGFYGCLIYDSTVSSRAIVAVYFGGSYSTSSGTIGITWDASGIAVIDVTP
jgi:hypothetical protein